MQGVKRITLLLLLFGAMLGLAGQAPASVLASMTPAPAQQMGAATMQDCKASMSKNMSHKRCNCLMADCATMAAGGAMTLADEGSTVTTIASTSLVLGDGAVTALIGRSVGPEPEPPTHLI